MNNNQFNEDLLRNMGININYKLLYVFSFLIQWSIIFLIINLVTLGFFRFQLYLIFIIDAISIIFNKNRTVLKPSIILGFIHGIISRLNNSNSNNYESSVINKFIYSLNSLSYKISNFISNTKSKLSNIKRNKNKYQMERQLNKFSADIGKKVYIESLSDGKITKKDFKYKDRAVSYVNMLKSNGYKDFTKYNLDINTAKAYIIFNKDDDIVNLDSNSVETSHLDNDYKFIISDWPRK